MEKSEVLKRFGARVKRYRELNGMTLQELADKSGYTSRSTVGKLEKGLVDVPQSKIKALADALGVSPLDLFGFEEVEERPYYTDPETAQIAQRIYEDRELRALFDAAADADPEDLQAVHAMLKALKAKERG